MHNNYDKPSPPVLVSPAAAFVHVRLNLAAKLSCQPLASSEDDAHWHSHD